MGLYLDEADVTGYTNAQLNLNTYDLERVEVLRGPQGTLYGDGSAGGTVRFITNSPNLRSFLFASDVAVLFTQDGAPSQRIQEVLNVPLVQDELGLRVAGMFEHDGGWIDQPAANEKDINGQNLADVRVKGLWKPLTQLSLTGLVDIHRNNRGLNEGENASGNYTQVFNQTTIPRLSEDFEIYNLTVAYDFAAARLLSTTSDIHSNNSDGNVGYTLPLSGPPDTAPVYDVLHNQMTIQHNVSQELRLTSIGDRAWQWTIGGFGRRFAYDSSELYYFGLHGPLPATAYPYDANYLSKSWAAFGDTSYRIADRLTVGAGVRYFRDDQNTTSGGYQAESFRSTDPRAYVRYAVNNSVSIYGSAGKGFRSGGFNQLSQSPYAPEDVWTYELGTKSSLLGGRLRADAALFYSRYTNYQVQGILPPPAPPDPIVTNAGTARIKGIEWDLAWHPADAWTLSLNGDYLDTEFIQINAASTAYAVGDPIDLVARYQGTASVQRDFRWDGKSAYFRLDYTLQGPETKRNRSYGYWYYSQSDIINLLNLNTGLEWRQGLRFGVFAQNLLNDRGYSSADIIERVAQRPRPRTAGIEFNVTFD